MMKLTENRELILSILDTDDWEGVRDSSDCVPPMSCPAIFALLDSTGGGGIKHPSIKQIERTVRDLVAAGLVSVIRQKVMVHGSMKCEKFVNHYELPHQSKKNHVKKYVVRALQDAETCIYKHHRFDKNLTCNSAITQIKTAIQRAHPDKFGDNSFINEFHKLKTTLEVLKKIKSTMESVDGEYHGS